MNYGSNEAVENAEDEYREHCARLIAQNAAQLVAAGDMGRIDAIEKVTEWLRREGQAEGDVTGVASIENEFPSPSKATVSLRQACMKPLDVFANLICQFNTKRRATDGRNGEG